MYYRKRQRNILVIKKQSDKKFTDYEKLLYSLRGESERQFDRQIVFLSSGALVFSIGFIKDIIGEHTIPKCQNFLITSWVLFTISLILNLVSYWSSVKSLDFSILYVERKSKFFNTITKWLNMLSIITLLLGILSLLAFIIINFN